MTKVFVDASVLYAALYSSTGAARDLLHLSFADRLTLIMSQDILAEVSKNLGKKAPATMPLLQTLIDSDVFELVDSPPAELVATAATYTVAKDAHVVASAIASQVDYLVTYDRKHLIDPPEVAEQSGLRIVIPAVVVEVAQNNMLNE